MTQRDTQSQAMARKSRLVAMVLIGTIAIYLLAQFLGPRLGLAGRYAILIDLLALAAFFWAFVVTYRIWRARRDGEGRQ